MQNEANGGGVYLYSAEESTVDRLLLVI